MNEIRLWLKQEKGLSNPQHSQQQDRVVHPAVAKSFWKTVVCATSEEQCPYMS